MKNVFTSLLLLVGICGFAQNETDFPDSDARWYNVKFSSYPNDISYAGEGVFTITNEDTLINGLTYSKLFLDENLYQGGIRRSEEKVYFILTTHNEEHLLYDFGAEVGDTLFDVFTGNSIGSLISTSFSVEDLVVQSESSIILNDGVERRVLVLDSQIEWIQGVGNKAGLLWRGGENVSNVGFSLIRFCHQDEVKYQVDSGSWWFEDDVTCGLDLIVNIDEAAFAQSLLFFPNPAREQLSFQLPHDASVSSIQVFDQLGKQVLFETNPSSRAIRVESFTPGVYLVKVISGDKVYRGKFVKVEE